MAFRLGCAAVLLGALGLACGSAETPPDRATPHPKHDRTLMVDPSDPTRSTLGKPSLRKAAILEDHETPIVWSENPMIDTAEDRLSSFGLEADTAAYALARETLLRGERPEPDRIRTEEFVNAFEILDAAPTQGDFAVHVEGLPSPYRPGSIMLRFGLRARDMTDAERPPVQIVFVVDVSNSMHRNGRLALVQDGLRMLAERLQPDDRIAIVTYGHRAQVALEPVAGDRRARILAAIDGLAPEGASNLDAGLALASALAAEAQGEPGRRIVVCSDGITHVGATEAGELLERVSNIAAQGVAISTVGVGLGSYNDALMEQLSHRGGGLHAYVDRREEVRRVFAENLTGQRMTVATHAEVQIEYDVRRVARYRRLGHEPRVPGHESGAGVHTSTIGAGHSVSTLYEIELHPDASAGPWGTLRLRYRDPGGRPHELEVEFDDRVLVPPELVAATPGRLAIVAAVFAEKLRASYWARELSWEDLIALHAELPTSTAHLRDVAVLGDLIHLAAALPFERSPAITARSRLERLPILQ